MKAVEISLVRVRGDTAAVARDRLAVERPLQIRARAGGAEHVLSTTMRTPGEDRALAAGFLFAEGVIAGPGAAAEVGVEAIDEDTVRVELPPGAAAALAATERRFVTSAACGVCGRSSLDGLAGAPAGAAREPGAPGAAAGAPPPRPQIPVALIHRLPAALREAQAVFAHTGGLHAAGLFTPDGAAVTVHEDVGRHNAVDKLVGTLLLSGRLPAGDGVLVVSGRASFELVQKAEAAGIPVMAAVGAPSSLAVERAAAAGMTLVGFVRDGGFNVYCGGERLLGLAVVG
jgi:FdhD protein